MNKRKHHDFYKIWLQNLVNGVHLQTFWQAYGLTGYQEIKAHDMDKTVFDLFWDHSAARYREDNILAWDAYIPRFHYAGVNSTLAEKTITPNTTKSPRRDTAHKVIGVLAAHAEATDAQQRLTRALMLLSKCNSTLVRATNEQDLLADICQLAIDVAGYQMAWVGFAQNDVTKSVCPVAQAGSGDKYLDTADISWANTERGLGPVGTAIREKIAIVNQDVLNNPLFTPWRNAALNCGFQSCIALPLMVNNKVLGALVIYASEPYAFNQEEVSLLEELANDLAFGIETLRMRLKHHAAEKKIEYLAYHDPLTGLPNRRLLKDRFTYAVNANQGQSGIGVLFLDLDNFKQVNDSLGHNYGDRFLVEVAARLQRVINNKNAILSRQGGDEFVILLINADDLVIVEDITQRIINAFVEPIHIDECVLSTSFSIGISRYPEDGREFDSLLKRADTALANAKESGRNTYKVFSEKMNSNMLEYMQLQEQLRIALKNHEFQLHYQPQIDAVNGQIIGVEALIRWQHPEQGMIPPGKFISVAERSGLIIPIGEWVLNEACRQAVLWSKTYNIPALVIAVNLSALQFKRGDLVETVTQALNRSGLPANQLELELTESVMLHDIDIVKATLYSLKRLGVRLSIDDFGTGYSCLSYLKQLAVDKLKIDQSFIRDMVEDSEDAAIVKAVIQLGHTLDLKVIAEGVEKEDQLALLRTYGVDEIQGYLISRPLTAQDFVTCYENQK